MRRALKLVSQGAANNRKLFFSAICTMKQFISISTQTHDIKLCNVGKYNQSKDEKADKQH